MAFQKGQSGNPGGRPKEIADVKALAREYTTEAIEKLADHMRSDNPKASIAACNSLLNRAWGTPTQAVEVTGKDGEPIQTDLRDMARSIVDVLRQAGKATDKDETP